MADAAFLLERPTKTRKIEDVVKELRNEANNGNARRKAAAAAAASAAIVTPPPSLVAPRYRIVPGTVIKSGNKNGKKPTQKVPPPPPPAEAPPTVTHRMNLALLGPPSSGKTSLVDSVVSRAYNTTDDHKNKGKKRKKIDQDQEGYYTFSEKDFAFSNDRCVNVRFLDVKGFEVSKSDERSLLTLESTKYWNKLYGRIHGVLLVVSLSNLYTEKDDDGDGAAEERLFSTVREWKTLVDHTGLVGSEKAVTLVLTNADKLSSGLLVGKPHHVDWVRLCSRLSKLCREIGISNWYTTSSVFGSKSSGTQMAPGDSFDAILRSISDHAEPANTTTSL